MYSRDSNKGLTVIELIIATLVTSFILVSTISLVVANRRLQNVDAARTSVNQTLRTSLEIIGIDVQLVGQRLNPDGVVLPAVTLESGNTITVRNSMVDSNLKLCDATINAAGIVVVRSQDWIDDYATTNSGGDPIVEAQLRDQLKSCQLVDSDGDGDDDRLQEWEAYRTANAPVKGFVANQAGDKTDFFNYADEVYDTDSDDLGRLVVGSPSFSNTYDILENTSIYILESRQYQLVGDQLQLIIDGDTSNPLTIVNGVQSFSVKAILPDGTEVTDMGTSNNLTGTKWTEVESFEVSISAEVTEGGTTTSRTLTSNFYPRNALSNPN